MEPDGTVGRTYNGRFYHEVDEKRRVQVPARWRPSEAGVELTLIVWPQANEGTCLRVKPPEQLAASMRELAGMANDPKKAALKRFIGGESAQVTLDKAGRICLPEDMAKKAGISERAVLVGLLDQFEIWSPERYERVQAADAILAQEAFKLMG